MKVNTSVKAGGLTGNRCENVRHGETAMTVKTGVKAGGIYGGIRLNRCEALRHTVVGK